MQIDAQSGLLTWPAGSIPSEDQDTTYPVTVRATDSHGNSADTNVLITVLTRHHRLQIHGIGAWRRQERSRCPKVR